MKMVHYINNLGSGGAEKLLKDVLPEMKKRGHEVFIVISNSKKSVVKYHNILESAEIPLKNFNCAFYNPFQIFKLIHFVKENKIDILLAHLFSTQYWAAFASFFLNKKTILVKSEHSTKNKRQNFILLKTIEKFIYGRYQKIIAITPGVKKKLVSWIGSEEKIMVIHNGINLKQIIDLKPNFSNVILKNTNKFNLLMVSRFDSKSKDHETFIKAIHLLSDEFHLFLAGEGPNLQKIKKLVNDLNIENKVTFLGYRNDVIELMMSCNLNVLSSFYERFSGVTLESLASGTPFIGSDVSGINNIVPDQRFLFPPKSPSLLAGKIKSVMSNSVLQLDMTDTAKIWIKKYDMNIMVDATLSLYKDLINKQ